MGSNPKAQTFSDWLRARMAEQQVSQRQLGKQLDPERPERGRRQVVRHLSGRHYPSKAYRVAYAELFGEEFVDDDEEPHPVTLTDVLTDLVREHRRMGRRLERLLSEERA